MATATHDSNLSQLTEHIRDWRSSDAIVDRENRALRSIALTGLESVNGYRYSRRALRDALPLYEGKPVFLDHARNLARPFERSTRDLVGTVVNARFENGRVRGDIQALDTEAGKTFLALAESKSSAVGMSHVVLARRNAENTVVESVEEVVSVDAVVFPATSSTFREQRSSSVLEFLPRSLESLLEQLDAQVPEHVARLRDAGDAVISRAGVFPGKVVIEVDGDGPRRCVVDWSLEDGQLRLGEILEVDTDHVLPSWDSALEGDVLRARVSSLESESGELRRRLEERDMQAAMLENGRRVEQLLQESQLPDYAVTDQWKAALISTPTEAAQRELIAERKTLLGQLRIHEPHSCERRDRPTPTGDTQFVAVIRGSRTPVRA